MNDPIKEESPESEDGFSLQEAERLIEGSADDLVAAALKKGITFEGLKFPVREMVEGEYGISKDDTSAMDFVFWVAFFTEKLADELIIDLMVMHGCQKVYAKVLVGNLTFGTKITSIEELYQRKKDPVLKIMRVIQGYRNHVAHGRYSQLIYKGHSLKGGIGQVLFIGDIKEAFKNPGQSTSSE
ncbi:MAG: hypothetical protein WAV21_01960 [Minisyncoccia bacterium]